MASPRQRAPSPIPKRVTRAPDCNRGTQSLQHGRRCDARRCHPSEHNALPSRAGRDCCGTFHGLVSCQRRGADNVGAWHRKVTAVAFEPAPLRNGALSHRSRPLGHTVVDTWMRSRLAPRAASRRVFGVFAPRVWHGGLPHRMPAVSAALQWCVNRGPLVGDRKRAALQIARAGSRPRATS